MSLDIGKLPWLPPPSEDFGSQCKDIAPDDGQAWLHLHYLASHSLTLPQLTKLSKIVSKCRDNNPLGGPPLTPFRLGIISNFTTDLISDALISTAIRHGILLQVTCTDYDQVMQTALNPEDPFFSAKPDALLLALDHRGLPYEESVETNDVGVATVDSMIEYLSTLREGVRAACNAPVIFQTLAWPPEPLFGSLDVVISGTGRSICAEFNKRLSDIVSDTPDVILDVAAIAEAVGLYAWHDPAHWHISKQGVSPRLIPLYADHVARLLGAIRGKSRRVLVLDLDNTIWGGVVGDDGVTNLAIGNGSPVGESFLALQKIALALHGRGVILAVCSKNDDNVARQPFRELSNMLLEENHFSSFHANWSDKASNLEAISEELNLGLDTFVFMDDNPAERFQVRMALPQVAVPELPNDPALFGQTLLSAGYFEAVNFTDTDLLRNAQYAANSKRTELKLQVRNLDDYLASLKMVAEFSTFDAKGRPRITQLINKSNQFNLTSSRYDEKQIADMEVDPQIFGLQVRLLDRFGDNGVICAVICRITNTSWDIDTWVMSCRVLGRGVETAVLNEIAARMAEHNVDVLIGKFIPSPRNEMVRDHYQKLGFRRLGETSGNIVWELRLNKFKPLPVAITGNRL